MLECWTVADLCRAQTRKWSWLSLRTRPGWVRPNTSISSSRGLRSGGAVTDWVDGMKPPGWDGSGVSNVGRGTQEARSPSRPARGAEHDRICLTELVPGGTLSTLPHLRLLARRPLAGPASLTSRTNGPDLVRKRVTWSRSPRLPP